MFEFSLWGVIQKLLSKSSVMAHGVLLTGHVQAPPTLVSGYCAIPEGHCANSCFVCLFSITLLK